MEHPISDIGSIDVSELRTGYTPDKVLQEQLGKIGVIAPEGINFQGFLSDHPDVKSSHGMAIPGSPFYVFSDTLDSHGLTDSMRRHEMGHLWIAYNLIRNQPPTFFDVQRILEEDIRGLAVISKGFSEKTPGSRMYDLEDFIKARMPYDYRDYPLRALLGYQSIMEQGRVNDSNLRRLNEARGVAGEEFTFDTIALGVNQRIISALRDQITEEGDVDKTFEEGLVTYLANKAMPEKSGLIVHPLPDILANAKAFEASFADPREVTGIIHEKGYQNFLKLHADRVKSNIR